MCNLYWQSLEQKVEFATVVNIFSQKVKVDDGALPILYNLTFFCITLPFFMHMIMVSEYERSEMEEYLRMCQLHILFCIYKSLSDTW